MFRHPRQQQTRREDDDDDDDGGENNHIGDGNFSLAETIHTDTAVQLEGDLLFRKGRRSTRSWVRWKRRHVRLHLVNQEDSLYHGAGGSMEILATVHGQRWTTSVLKTASNMVSFRNNSNSNNNNNSSNNINIDTALINSSSSHHSSTTPGSNHKHSLRTSQNNKMSQDDIYIPSHWHWTAKDVEHDSNTFVVEIPPFDDDQTTPNTGGRLHNSRQTNRDNARDNSNRSCSSCSSRSSSNGDLIEAHNPSHDDEENDKEDGQDNGMHQHFLSTVAEDTEMPIDQLQQDVHYAHQRGKPLRLYFKCQKGSNEKALWLRAFSRLGRLSTEVRRRKGIWAALTPNIRERIRNSEDETIIRDTRHLDLTDTSYDDVSVMSTDVERLVHHPHEHSEGQLDNYYNDKKEFRVLPTYAYPHRWMTRQELKDEMVLPSTNLVDLRVDTQKKEIGELQVEVLQCLGLPKLERTSDTDAIAYLVCGSYAFHTDIIPNRSNPMWLRKTKRACIFPLFEAYARLYVGVFNHDQKRTKDDFCGRVAVDLARLRPHSTYDVTIPLRLSTHVYSRRRRGAIRLRFRLIWNSERDTLFTYIPKTLRIPLPQHTKPNTKVTVACADAKSFRNIAITVHGAHMPGRFTFQQMRAAIREINLTRKFIFVAIRQEIKATRQWMNPAISAFVFFSWMHCVWANSFALVPAYIILWCLLQLMRMYANFGMDGPVQYGFIPPSWEELMMCLLAGYDSRETSQIKPLELGMRTLPVMMRREGSDISTEDRSMEITGLELYDYKITTHIPKGKAIFRTLGILPSTEEEYSMLAESHLEFPFSNCCASDYPRFTVRECLARYKGTAIETDKQSDGRSAVDKHRDSFKMTTNHKGEMRIIPRWTLDMQEQLPNLLLRKDSSGMSDFDVEEDQFGTRQAVLASGKALTRRAKKTVTSAAEITGLDYVMSPAVGGLKKTINYGVSGVESGVKLVGGGVGSGVNAVRRVSQYRRKSSHGAMGGVDESGNSLHPVNDNLPGDVIEFHRVDTIESITTGIPSLKSHASSAAAIVDEVDVDVALNSVGSSSSAEDDIISYPVNELSAGDEADVWPEQNIDVEGPSTGKKVTDDMAEIKDKMHEMTWHLFNDKTYVVRDKENVVYFGEAKKKSKRQKQKDIDKQLDKLLQIGQYSHPNPFVARVGLYIEPIVGSAYSFLCVFRAGFNILTWRDPMLTFLLSVVLGLLGIVLLVFPWRIFLFFCGMAIVGPQNWLIRLLRERGKLSPVKVRLPEPEPVPTCAISGQPIFLTSEEGKDYRSTPKKSFDHREVHHVVVPCTPLQYQRFYDWPPEPQYAQVRRDYNDSRKATKSNLMMLAESRKGSKKISDFMLRRRARFLHRSGIGVDSSDGSSGGTAGGHQRHPSASMHVTSTRKPMSLQRRSVSDSTSSDLIRRRRRFHTGDWSTGSSLRPGDS